MEIPRFWRISPVAKGFRMESDGTVLRYPGGEIPLTDSLEKIQSRLLEKGFKPEVIEEVLLNLFGAISSEAAIPEGEVVKSFLELLRSEVGEEDWSKVKLGVNRLPR